MLKRLLYFIYYLKKKEHKKIKPFLKYASTLSGKSKLTLIFDMTISVFKYNISLTDYFYFRFFEKERNERIRWAGTGFMYEYQLQMNPEKKRQLLENKVMFLNHFQNFIKRKYFIIDDLKAAEHQFNKISNNSSGFLVLKNSSGQAGAEVEVIKVNEFTRDSLIKYMENKKFDLVEEYIIQHPLLMGLSPSGLNTVRIITQLNDKVVDFIAARLRISVNSHVDNMAAGNIAAPVNLLSGCVTGPGVYSDVTKEDEAIHPVTGHKIEGFKIPYWEETVSLVERAAKNLPQNRSVGWDIAITENGPELIEGNHNWCKLLWQLPVKEGLKQELDRYL